MRLPKLQFLHSSLLAVAAASSVFGQSYTISTFAGGGLPVNIPGASASIGRPQAVAVDKVGNVFLSYPNYYFPYPSVVLRLDTGTGELSLVAGTGTAPPGFSGDGGPATSAQLNYPKGVAVDSAGNVYIADSYNWRIRKVSNGVITTVAGDGTQGFSGDGGPATSAEFSGLSGVAVDSAGKLYISDGNRVREVSDGMITTIAGNGTAGFSGDGGPAVNAQLWGPPRRRSGFRR
jgi:hypothetical protein